MIKVIPLYRMRKLFFLFLVLPAFSFAAQNGFSNEEAVTDFNLKTVLNFSTSSSSFNTIKKDLTIVDFFGTWCAPCNKALPHLAAVQKKVDYRIHFALNCGAKSCPPIVYYSPEKLDQQLEDFGGKKGMREILKSHNIIPEAANPKIKFKDYNWTLELSTYKTE
jgi:thiol-disulfide isomerase/thioredoxin